MWRVFVKTVLIGIVLSCSTVAQAKKLHVIAVGDLSPSAKWGDYTMNVQFDLISIRVLFTNGIPERQLDLQEWVITEDEYSDPEWILNRLKDVHPESGDTILFYFTGHGAADDDGHYLSLARGKLHRRTLLETLRAKNARLTVLLTDCCNLRSDGLSFGAPFVETRPPRQVLPVLQSLLFNPMGTVDINSCSPGESAFFRSKEHNEDGLPGSIFTGELTAWINEHEKESRSWDELVRAVSLNVLTAFRSNYPKGAQVAKGEPVQQKQTVFPVSYPGMPEGKGPRTGLLVRSFSSGTGAVITQIAADSPGRQVYDFRTKKLISLKPQQVIVSVEGQRVSNADELLKILQSSPQIVRLGVRDINGSQFDVLMRMKY